MRGYINTKKKKKKKKKKKRFIDLEGLHNQRTVSYNTTTR